MYSMVLLMAMSTPAEAPSFGHHHNACCGGSCYGVNCHGCGGCTGYGPIAYYGFAGCYGSCYGSYTNYFSYWSTPPNTHYGYGMPMHAMPVAPAGIVVPDTQRIPPVAPPVAPVKPEIKPEGKIGQLAAPATVVVSVPADAILFANGHRTNQAVAERRFVTPALPAGERFHYEFTAEVVRDGQVVKETKQIEVAAGRDVRVEFTLGAVNPTRVATK